MAGGSPATGSIPASDIAVGDADGDRRLDVIVGLSFSDAHRSRPGDGMVVLRGRPGRRLAARVRPTAVRAGRDSGVAVPQLLAGDLDADGALDLVFQDVVVRGLGRGRFAAPEALAPVSRDADGFSVARALVARRGRLDVLGATRRTSDAVARLGIVTRGAKALRPATFTGLQSKADDFSRFSVEERCGALAAGRFAVAGSWTSRLRRATRSGSRGPPTAGGSLRPFPRSSPSARTAGSPSPTSTEIGAPRSSARTQAAA